MKETCMWKQHVWWQKSHGTVPMRQISYMWWHTHTHTHTHTHAHTHTRTRTPAPAPAPTPTPTPTHTYKHQQRHKNTCLSMYVYVLQAHLSPTPTPVPTPIPKHSHIHTLTHTHTPERRQAMRHQQRYICIYNTDRTYIHIIYNTYSTIHIQRHIFACTQVLHVVYVHVCTHIDTHMRAAKHCGINKVIRVLPVYMHVCIYICTYMYMYHIQDIYPYKRFLCLYICPVCVIYDRHISPVCVVCTYDLCVYVIRVYVLSVSYIHMSFVCIWWAYISCLCCIYRCLMCV